VDLELNFNGFGLNDGIYEADITISSNDPVTPEFDVDATLKVTRCFRHISI